DLDTRARAGIQLDAARARDTAAAGRGTLDALAGCDKLDVVRPEIQRCRTVGPVRRKEAGAPSPVQNLAGGDLDRQGRGFADEAVDEGRGRPVIDLVRRTDLFD